MKKLVCELCGESDFVKAGGVFECQVCGAKYTLEDARKLFVEINDAPSAPAKPAPVEEAILESKKDNAFEEDAVLTPKPAPTAVRRVVVQPKAPSNDINAVKKIVSNVQKTAH